MIFINSILVIFCGFILKSNYAKINPLIIGGEYASIKEYPHAAHLSVKYIDEPSQKSISSTCGASILSQKILVTAAHCLFITSDELERYFKDVDQTGINQHIFATVGHSNVTGRETNTVVSFKIHEHYLDNRDGATLNDIALLKLKSHLQFSITVKSVVIMKSAPHEPGRIAGWGNIDLNRTKTNLLKHLRNLELWSNNGCSKRFYSNKKFIEEDIICTANSTRSNGMLFHGDSGSGLIVQQNILVGVASHILERERGILAYTKVGYHYKWIKKIEKEFNKR